MDVVFRGLQDQDVAVITSVEGEVSFATIGPTKAPRGPDKDIQPGCLTKLLTATLLEQLISQGALHAEDPAGSFFPNSSMIRASLEGITVRQLLEHTHGLDDSTCIHLPRSFNGFIDGNGLLEACTKFRLSLPGEIYSYSNAGAWIVAAVLESWHDAPYETILEKQLLEPLGIRTPCFYERYPASGIKDLCPATGGASPVCSCDTEISRVGSRARKLLA